jgi:hypothetical protein
VHHVPPRHGEYPHPQGAVSAARRGEIVAGDQNVFAWIQ